MRMMSAGAALVAVLAGFAGESGAQDRPRAAPTACPSRLPDGPFSCTLPDGRGIIGRIVNGRVNGNVQMTFTNGDWYVGLLADGRPHGPGRYFHASGARFEGQFANGLRVGLGMKVWPSGDRFQGEYRNDLPNGFGTVWLSRGMFKGTWVNGCLASARIAVDRSPAECGF